MNNAASDAEPEPAAQDGFHENNNMHGDAEIPHAELAGGDDAANDLGYQADGDAHPPQEGTGSENEAMPEPEIEVEPRGAYND